MARIIFVDENQLRETGRQFGLASAVQTERTAEMYINVNDLIAFLRKQNDADADLIASDACSETHPADIDMKVVGARWRAVNDIIQALENGTC